MTTLTLCRCLSSKHCLSLWLYSLQMESYCRLRQHARQDWYFARLQACHKESKEPKEIRFVKSIELLFLLPSLFSRTKAQLIWSDHAFSALKKSHTRTGARLRASPSHSGKWIPPKEKERRSVTTSNQFACFRASDYPIRIRGKKANITCGFWLAFLELPSNNDWIVDRSKVCELITWSYFCARCCE